MLVGITHKDSIKAYLKLANSNLTWGDEGFLYKGEICPQEEINNFIIEAKRDYGYRIMPAFVEPEDTSEDSENDEDSSEECDDSSE
jgi:hypothetical protein